MLFQLIMILICFSIYIVKMNHHRLVQIYYNYFISNYSIIIYFLKTIDFNCVNSKNFKNVNTYFFFPHLQYFISDAFYKFNYINFYHIPY
jgi:hypothetical protein